MLLETYADYAIREQTAKLKPEVIHHAKRAVIDWYACCAKAGASASAGHV